MEIFNPKQHIFADSQEYSTKIDNTFDRPDLLIERRAFLLKMKFFVKPCQIIWKFKIQRKFAAVLNLLMYLYRKVEGPAL